MQAREETEQAGQGQALLRATPACFDAAAEPCTEVDWLLRCRCVPAAHGCALDLVLPAAQVRRTAPDVPCAHGSTHAAAVPRAVHGVACVRCAQLSRFQAAGPGKDGPSVQGAPFVSPGLLHPWDAGRGLLVVTLQHLDLAALALLTGAPALRAALEQLQPYAALCEGHADPQVSLLPLSTLTWPFREASRRSPGA